MPICPPASFAQRRRLPRDAQGRGPGNRPGGDPQRQRRANSLVMLHREPNGRKFLVSLAQTIADAAVSRLFSPQVALKRQTLLRRAPEARENLVGRDQQTGRREVDSCAGKATFLERKSLCQVARRNNTADADANQQMRA